MPKKGEIFNLLEEKKEMGKERLGKMNDFVEIERKKLLLKEKKLEIMEKTLEQQVLLNTNLSTLINLLKK